MWICYDLLWQEAQRNCSFHVCLCIHCQSWCQLCVYIMSAARSLPRLRISQTRIPRLLQNLRAFCQPERSLFTNLSFLFFTQIHCMSRKHMGASTCIDHSLLRIYLTSPQKPVGLLNRLWIQPLFLGSWNLSVISVKTLLSQAVAFVGNKMSLGAMGHLDATAVQPDAIFHLTRKITKAGIFQLEFPLL